MISGGGNNKTEILHPGFSAFEPFDDLPINMTSHAMVKVNESFIIFLGSTVPRASDKVYAYDLIGKKFIELPPMKQARSSLHAGKYCTIPYSSVYIIWCFRRCNIR